MATRVREACDPESAELLFKLESVVELYKSCRNGADELDKLAFLAALKDIRNLISKTEGKQRLSRKEILDFKKLLKDLNSQVKTMALENLFRELTEVKLRIGMLERRLKETSSVKLPLPYSEIQEDDETWNRLTEKRQEILGRSSLILRSTIPRRMYNVRFDLGLSAPVLAGTGEETAQESQQEKRAFSITTEELLQSRINRLQEFLRERKERLRHAKQRTNISSGLIKSTDCFVHQSKDALQRARAARHGYLDASRKPTQVSKRSTSEKETPSHCEECLKILKERDTFWGLESDSEEDEEGNTRMGRDGARDSARDRVRYSERDSERDKMRDSMRSNSGNKGINTTRVTGEEVSDFLASLSPRNAGSRSNETEAPLKLTSFNLQKAYVIKQKPDGLAGRGTWATPAYEPPWTVIEVDKKRKSLTQLDRLTLEEARFGNTKGTLRKLFARMSGLNRWK